MTQASADIFKITSYTLARSGWHYAFANQLKKSPCRFRLAFMGSFHRTENIVRIKRDTQKIARLSEQGWKSLVVWSCEVKDEEMLIVKLQDFLDGSSPHRIRRNR